MAYIICEIGQNHNGSMELAKRLIDMATMPIIDKFTGTELRRADAVKFTKRDLEQELSDSLMDRPYTGVNSFGKTYGDHRRFLELSNEQHYELYQYAKERGTDFVETLCAPKCLDILDYFNPDKLKVASRDLTNLPLLKAMAETKIPIILSTGMSGEKELNEAIDLITDYHGDITILHCLSQYPAEYQNINLKTLEYLRNKFPQYKIGYSDHSIGIMVPVAAVALGAEVIEKHVTLDRTMKGSDHAGSLEPDGVWRMVRDIRNLERALGVNDMIKSKAAEDARLKLERSIATKVPVKKGERIKLEDLHLLSPGDGFKWNERASVLGKKVTEDLEANQIIYPKILEGYNK